MGHVFVSGLFFGTLFLIGYIVLVVSLNNRLTSQQMRRRGRPTLDRSGLRDLVVAARHAGGELRTRRLVREVMRSVEGERIA